MPTVNESLRDAAISHQVDLQHYSNGVVRRIIAILNRVDSDLVAQLSVALERINVTGATLTVERIQSLLVSVRHLNADAFAVVQRELPAELRNLAEYEGSYQRQLWEDTLQVNNLVQSVNLAQTYAAAMARPFQGRLLSEWTEGLEQQRMVRIRDAIRMGVVENQTNQEIINRIRGTRAQGYTDGILEIDRRDAEAVVRTAVQHVAGFTRDEFMEVNDDLVAQVQWVSTLDTRTTPQCQIRDGKLYDTEGKPEGHSIPWLAGPGRLHWQCRSTSCPVLKSFRELGLDIDELDEGTRASMDGQVASDTTYGGWLRRQSAERQDEVLGATRGEFFRSGGVSFDKFFNNKGAFLDLDDLRERDEARRR